MTWILVWGLLAVSASLAYHTYSESQRLQRPLQIQILNGTEVVGLARVVADKLRSPEIDVVSVGNADDSGYPGTLVLLRRGPMSHAHRLVERLGMGKALKQQDPTLLVDVTVVLGRDYGRAHAGAGLSSLTRR